MAKKEGAGFSSSPWLTIARAAFTAVFFYWLYWIGISTVDLGDKINAAADRFTAIDSLEVEFKDEIQDWKDLLLRSDSRDALNKNWLIFDAQYRKVAADAEAIIAKNDVRSIRQKMQDFVEAHKANHEKYKASAVMLLDNKFDHRPADAAVKGIDRPLLDMLRAANADMHDEKDRTNSSLVAAARGRIELSLFALAFIGLLAIWMPKY